MHSGTCLRLFTGAAIRARNSCNRKLVRLMAIGGGSIGWILELESAVTVDGKPVNSILVSYRETKNWKMHV